MAQQEIILYDIPRQELEKGGWSGNTLKARLALEFKGLPYKTVWVEYPDIAAHCHKIGAPPTGQRDGKPLYTLPVIKDPNTNAVVSDSYAIAEYLDAHYAAPRPLIPAGTEGLQAAFFKAVTDTALRSVLHPTILKRVSEFLNPPSQEYFIRTREAVWGKLDDVCPPGPKREQQMKAAKAGFDIVNGWYAKAGEDKLYLMGDTPSWADIIVAAYTLSIKRIHGENSDEWRQLSSWHGGRWAKLVDALGSST
ncbi:hypothetical protein GLOTRDRAFT_74336 [Gloeophyllum trabeum ATCC 11539]|uniref:GST N-terminal domain-containing protein n=1 Tax=Gloeophyllum trabeum (strain ATCC 11539 / FP-39264 / Madison 617) TaxID=670483 RepID=S7QDS4_GLOTA|nr:uncharacterized protein GLOTRDRAFT_74336 [Gloeophyllum trabeum ATCC 11539]EPQ57497.1 hypothetical protein GLOTRDRAFT_74336 [Gloeophyllum trabeum ATCC 11539]